MGQPDIVQGPTPTTPDFVRVWPKQHTHTGGQGQAARPWPGRRRGVESGAGNGARRARRMAVWGRGPSDAGVRAWPRARPGARTGGGAGGEARPRGAVGRVCAATTGGTERGARARLTGGAG
jgi:hypothetical protein